MVVPPQKAGLVVAKKWPTRVIEGSGGSPRRGI